MTTTDPLFGMLFALGGSPGQVSPLLNLLPFAAVLAIFYFVILLPMKSRQKKVADFWLRSKSATRSSPHGGLFGSIAKLGDDAVQLQIAPNVRVDISTGRDRRLPGSGARCRNAEYINHGEESALETPHHRRCRCAGGVFVLPARQESRLGLDLKGGVHLVLRVQTDRSAEARDADHRDRLD
jgi:preprotein translocase subunit YajC